MKNPEASCRVLAYDKQSLWSLQVELFRAQCARNGYKRKRRSNPTKRDCFTSFAMTPGRRKHCNKLQGII